jgi:hypothetical protein
MRLAGAILSRPRSGRLPPAGMLRPAERADRPGLGEECRQILRPQGQIAAREIFGVGHAADYIPSPSVRQRAARRRRGFDAAAAPKGCIVAAEDFSRGETART